MKGYEPRDGILYEPHTTIEGVLEKDTGQGEFMSPKRLLECSANREFGRYADQDLGTLPVNFLSTGDITNGSSGSATLNAGASWSDWHSMATTRPWDPTSS